MCVGLFVSLFVDVETIMRNNWPNNSLLSFFEKSNIVKQTKEGGKITLVRTFVQTDRFLGHSE